MSHYRLDDRYIGFFDGVEPPAGAEECSAPLSATDLWVDGAWCTSEEQSREQFKEERDKAVSAITVTISSGEVFDGDERSQERMARTLVALEDDETTLWVLADNTTIQVTKAQLREALRLAGQRQTELWVEGNNI